MATLIRLVDAKLLDETENAYSIIVDGAVCFIPKRQTTMKANGIYITPWLANKRSESKQGEYVGVHAMRLLPAPYKKEKSEKQPTDKELLQQILQTLIEIRDMLRTRFDIDC